MTLNQFLTYLALAAFLAFLLITAAALITGKASLSGDLRRIDPTPEELKAENPDSMIYDLIGQIRAPTKPDSSDRYCVVLITPWFEYAADDREFYEELDVKLRGIKAKIFDYISTRTEKELRKKGELAVKADLLELINESLVLGKVNAVYFRDYEFIK